ncbi:MAG: transposase, partial [Cyanobacteria bacterium P01_E01_bin.34]
GRIAQLLQEAGCQLWYLPPYSPDLNQIEHCWAWIKARVHRCKHQFESLRDVIEHVLRLSS